MNNLPNEILEIIWSFDSTFHEKYKKYINKIDELCSEKRSLIISINNFNPEIKKNNLEYIIKSSKKICKNLNLLQIYWKKIHDSNIYEQEIYKIENEIQYKIYFINYPNLR